MGVEVLAEKFLATTAVKALPAQLGVICDNTLANCEALDLWSVCSNNTDGFVA